MSFISVALSGAGLSADIVGVPGLSAGGSLLQEINAACERIGVHRDKCRQLSGKTAMLLNVLEEQGRKMERDDMRNALNELEPVLRKVLTDVRKYAQYGRAERIWRSGEVEKGLERCMASMDTAITDFQATLVMHTNQTVERNHAEVKDMLAQILATPEPHLHPRLQYIQKTYSPGALSEFYGAAQEHLHSLPQFQGLNRARPSTGPMPSTPRASTEVLGAQFLVTQRIMRELVQMGVAPKVRILDGEVVKLGEVAQAGGTYSDVWLGDWLNGKKVALKALRNIRPEEKAIRRFRRQVDVWSRLKHDNILPFYGICVNLLQNICMVSAWQENGDVRKFVERNPDAQKIRLMRGAADGMAYLHAQGVVHGNLKCSNILVSETFDARICDFGMSKIIEEVTDNAASQTLTASGSARWLAPELITGAESSPTLASDVYSWAMSVLECLTAKNPYSYCKRDANVVYEVVTNAKIPRRPVGEGPGVDYWLTDDLWALLEQCWSHDLTKRPDMAQVAARMHAIEAAHQRLLSQSFSP